MCIISDTYYVIITLINKSMKKTKLYEKHVQAGAKMVDFAGWDMPLHYGSQINEHKVVRSDAGIFDVSHMRFLTIQGVDAEGFMRRLICGDVASISENQGLYSCMLNENGGIIDDLIAYKIDNDNYHMVVNAGTAAKDLAWMHQQAGGMQVEIIENEDRSILALQGPKARDKFASAFPEHQAASALNKFHFTIIKDMFIARTGYTGEDGYEIVIPNEQAEDVWDRIIGAGFTPAGLGSRDTLRLEAGLSLYGNDLDEDHSPLASALSWTVNWNKDDDQPRDFIGKEALLKEKEAGIKHRLVGLYITTPGVLRAGSKAQTPEGEGVLTSGGFSPTLNHSIALARIPFAHKGGECQVNMRDKLIDARIIRPPFVKDGKASDKIV